MDSPLKLKMEPKIVHPRGKNSCPPTSSEEPMLPIVQKWSTASSKSVEVMDIHPSVPLDIALLHIKTDELLESLRQSAITPKYYTNHISPTSTRSTFDFTLETESSSCSSHNREGAMTKCREEEDCNSLSSVDSDDDGVKLELEQLTNITVEMRKSFSDFVYSATMDSRESKHLLHLNWSEGEVSNEMDNILRLLLRDILMLFKDTVICFLGYSIVKKMISSKTVRYLSKVYMSSPRRTVMVAYMVLSMACFCVKKAFAHSWYM